jgi:hypothetical protein
MELLILLAILGGAGWWGWKQGWRVVKQVIDPKAVGWWYDEVQADWVPQYSPPTGLTGKRVAFFVNGKLKPSHIPVGVKAPK